MHIVVPIKQVPETSNVKMDPETGTMIRDGVGSVINPLDLYALETALRIKERGGAVAGIEKPDGSGFHGGGRGGADTKITVLSMGPSPAERAVREALSMGCDRGFLVSDRKFGGADTWATSYTLAQAVKRCGEQYGPVDVVIAGERATDGDTAQVGPGIAAWLGVPAVTYVARIVELSETAMRAERLVEEGYQSVEVRLPAVLTVVKEIAAPRLPTLGGKKRAKAAEVPVLNSENMELDPAALGLRGSPTKVVRIATPKVTRGGITVVAAGEGSTEEAVDRLVAFLDDKGLLPGGER